MVTETFETLLKHRLADQSERVRVQFLDTSKKPGPSGRRLMNHPGYPGLFRALVETSANLIVTETYETLLKHRLADQPERARVQILDTSKKPGPGGRRLMNHPGYSESGRQSLLELACPNFFPARVRAAGHIQRVFDGGARVPESANPVAEVTPGFHG